MKLSITTESNGIVLNLNKKLERINSMQGFLNKNVYQMYQNAQRTRWMTENSSETGRWKRLEPRYEQYKRTKFASYDGQGTKMLIATGALFKAVVGPGNGQRKVATNKSLYISVSTPYSGYVDEVRSMSTWSQKTIHDWHTAISNFIFFAKEKSV